MSNPSLSEASAGAREAALPSLFEASGEIPLLIGIEQDLRLMIEPAVSEPEAKHTIGMIRRIILDIVARRLEEPVTAPIQRAARWDALHNLIALAHSLGGSGQKLADRLMNDLPRDGEQSDVSDLLGKAFGELAAVPGTESPAFSAKLGKILAGLLKNEKSVEARHRATAERIETQQKPGAHDPGVITLDRFEQFMREQMPNVSDLKVMRMTRPPMGWGKVTLIADLEGTDLPYSSVVIRQDAALSGTNTQVIDEYPIIKFVSDHGLQVPEPLFLSPETGRFGRPFIVMSKLSGATGGGFSGPNPECTREALFDLARFAAKLHALDPRESDLPAIWTATPDKDANRLAVANVHRQMVENQVSPMPLARGTLLWLERNAPRSPDRPIVVHSDLGLWNLLVEGPKVTAVLDWELAHIGDPMQDLAYVRPLLGDRMTWQEFIDAYLAAGGQEYRPDAIEFFGMLSDVRNVMFTEIMHNMAVSNVVEVRTAHAVTTCLRMLERQAASKLPAIGG
ncbi:phosphotransferase family protein [Sphingobium sp. YR768]|uniref:phosphotransferase family protein n=1 Tax=Sphingobium sp. YR768 TaxID=1884365 RepID=UPI0008C60C5F|nr:phosphotransferase family protein [Sphingobium sp. YR768]SES17070.1 Predicted kinase, aminoglycoside phosphotransferase (APT) family [Sphingobium sp. YR768]